MSWGLLVLLAGLACCGLAERHRRRRVELVDVARLISAPGGEADVPLDEVRPPVRARVALLFAPDGAVVADPGRASGWDRLVGRLGRLGTRRQRRRLEAQFPSALALLATSLQAGNSVLRSLQSIAERAEDPLAGELRRVVNETELGNPLPDAFDAMAARTDVDDVRAFARALRIQQASGGHLAPLAARAAEMMVARAELRREARTLTAEGRLSAWVLGGLPVGLMAACQATNPGYLAPLFQGKGWLVLGLTAASVLAGVAIILRMVDPERLA